MAPCGAAWVARQARPLPAGLGADCGCKSRDCRPARWARRPRTSDIGNPTRRRPCRQRPRHTRARCHGPGLAPMAEQPPPRPEPQQPVHSGLRFPAPSLVSRNRRQILTPDQSLASMPDDPRPAVRRSRRLGIAHATVKHPPRVHGRAGRAPARQDPRRPHQEPVPARQEIRALSGGGAGRRRDRPQGPAPAARRQRALLVRLVRPAARGLGGRARRGDAVRRHQRHPGPRHAWCSMPP